MISSKQGIRALEAFIGSVGILAVGMLTIPLAVNLVGADISAQQGLGMGTIFFVGRFLWLYVVRLFFSRITKE